jgi:hypothetical protein
MPSIKAMNRKALIGLMCAVAATHLAVLSAVVETSTTRNSVPVERLPIQYISLLSPAKGNAALSIQNVSREVPQFQPDLGLSKARPTARQASDLATESTTLDIPDPLNKGTTSDETLDPDLMVETAEGQIALAEVLSARLPYLTTLVTLEFLIDSDGTTKQVNCLENSCSDAIVASLSALLDLRFKPTRDVQVASESRKVIEIEPAQRF